MEVEFVDVKKTTRPKIFSLTKCPVLGDLGPRTKFKQRVICSTCKRVIVSELGQTEYVFDGWHGEDIATATLEMVYVVTSRLRKAMQNATIKGVRFKKVLTTRSELFLDIYGDIRLPTFYELLIEDTLEGGGWMKRDGACNECGQPFWSPINASVKWVAGGVSEESLPPRRVLQEEWKGQDIFLVTEPGPPVATERVASIFAELKTPDVKLDPASWETPSGLNGQ
jgi:hypothetical protein